MPPISFAWESLVRCGDPAVAAVGALWNPADVRQRLVRLSRQCRGGQQMGGCGSRPTRATPGRPDAPTGSMRWRPNGARRRTRQAVLPLPGRRRNVRPLLHPGRRDAVRGRAASRAPTAPTAIRASSAPRPSRIRRRAGRISIPTCRRGPRSLPSPRRAAARSPDARLLEKALAACDALKLPR